MKNLLKRICIFSRYLLIRYVIKMRSKAFCLYNKVKIFDKPLDKMQNSFFGYYNISPFNKNNDVLFNCTKTYKIRGINSDFLYINLLKKDGNKVIEITKTKSWNWQQGCMLQWYANSDDKIIFNNYDEYIDEYYAEILNIKTKHNKRICLPIYSVSKDGSFALTLNFDRLATMRPDYGYFNKKDKKLPDDSNDGIWLVDIENNRSRLIISLEKLKRFKPNSTMVNSKHKVNHLDISPDGKRFMFLHRWIGPEGRFMRLLAANCDDGSDLFYITGDVMVSHSCWWGDNDLISFCRLRDGRGRYAHFKDKLGFVEIIGENDFIRDGHPSVSPDGKWMLTDDYPDLARFSRLFLYNLFNKKKYLIGEFYQPLKFTGEKRIDLHPKWSRDLNSISIDSGHNGQRCLYNIDISHIIF